MKAVLAPHVPKFASVAMTEIFKILDETKGMIKHQTGLALHRWVYKTVKSDRSVDISAVEYDEETMAVVFRNGNVSTTRHYQPLQYLGTHFEKIDGATVSVSNSKVYSSQQTRCGRPYLVDDVMMFLGDGRLPKIGIR